MAMTSYKHGAFDLLSLSIHAKASSYMSEDPSCTTSSFFCERMAACWKVVATTFLLVFHQYGGVYLENGMFPEFDSEHLISHITV